MVSERTSSTEIRLTQEFLSQMLGAHRPSITVVLGALEQDGLISRRRGVIDIVDIERLEAAACECYRKVRDYSERVFDLNGAV